MPNLKWSSLSSMQLGRYAEYYAKMELTSYGFDVYTSEVDDHGVDFVAKALGGSKYYEIQVKSVRDYNYVYIPKSKMPELTDVRLVCYMHFLDGNLPDVFIIPATAWSEPDAVLVNREYDKPGQTSDKEWGINISRKNYHLLDKYKIDIQLPEMK